MIVGILFYLAYALATGSFLAPGLIVISSIMAFTSPVFARVSNELDDAVAMTTNSGLLGRIARIAFQWLVNAALVALLAWADVLSIADLATLGGVVGASFLATIASQGFQHIGVHLASKGFGNAELNVLLALSSSLLLNAFAMAGTQPAQLVLLGLGYGLSVLGLSLALWVDVKRWSAQN